MALTDTAYTALQAKVADLNRQITLTSQKLTALQNDPSYLTSKTQLATIDGLIQSDPAKYTGTWIDGNGVVWKDSSTAGIQAAVRQNVQNQQTAILTAQNQLSDLQNSQLPAATKALTNYQTNSPTIKAQIAADSSNTALIIVAIILFLLLIISIIIYRINKKKKKTTP